jgi:predicted RecB family nuclease
MSGQYIFTNLPSINLDACVITYNKAFNDELTLERKGEYIYGLHVQCVYKNKSGKNIIIIETQQMFDESVLSLYLDFYNITECVFFICQFEQESIINIQQVEIIDTVESMFSKSPCTKQEISNIVYQKWLSSSLTKLNNDKIYAGKRIRGSCKTAQQESTINAKEYVSASKLKNYILNDTLSDWLDEFHHKSPSLNKFQEAMYQKGNKFEEVVVRAIKAKCNDNEFYQIATSSKDTVNLSKFLETVECIRNKVPIIYQGVLHNIHDKTFGCPDLLIRNDYFYKLFPYAEKSSCKNTYKIVEIKSSNIVLKADEEQITNTPMMRFYKCQLYLYNQALDLIQGETSSESYVLAKKYQCKDKCWTWANKLAVVNYENDESIKDLYKNAVKWIKYCRTGKDWDPRQPHILELLPNLKNKYCTKWQKYKQELVENGVDDITEICQCTMEHKAVAIKNKITKWRDQHFNPSDIGISKLNKNYSLIHLFIKMNQNMELFRQNFNTDIQTGLIHPHKLQCLELKKTNTIEFYVDFESLNTAMFDEYTITHNAIFMIGVGYYNAENNWIYKSFIAQELDNEKDIIVNFLEYIFLLTKKVKLFHWGAHEKTMLIKKISEYELSLSNNKITYIDLCETFKTNQIVIRGALNYNLKTIATAFYKNGFIASKWPSEISNGLDAMVYANEYYKEMQKRDENVMLSIVDYNEIDCRVMAEILTHLRANHL